MEIETGGLVITFSCFVRTDDVGCCDLITFVSFVLLHLTCWFWYVNLLGKLCEKLCEIAR